MRSLFTSLLTVMTVGSLLVGCSKNNNDSIATTPYSISNGVCYNGNQAIDSSYCTNISNYYQVNGYCYDRSGNRVDNFACGNNGGLTLQPHRCDGTYYATHGGRNSPVRCNDRNCRGNLMFNPQGQPVHCL